MIRSFASFVMALLLITSGIGGFTGQAAAANGLPQGCSEIDNFIHDLLTFQNVNEGSSPCSTSAQVNQAIQDMQQSDANQTKVDIYTAGTSAAANLESWGATFDNYVQDTESAAWMKMQVAVAEAYQNGSSKSAALVAAREAISDYYAVKQKNIIRQWNTTVTEWWYLRQQAQNETGISKHFVTLYASDKTWTSTGGGSHSASLSTTSVSLVNGSSVSAVQIDASLTFQTSNTYHVYWDITPTGVSESGATWSGNSPTHLEIRPPNSNYNNRKFLRFSKMRSRLTRIENLNSNLQAEAENFVNATYADFNSGQINASDVISANTAMFEYGTRTANGSSNFYNSVGGLALMGFDTPNVSSSGTFDIQYNNNTYTGLVFARNAPNGRWVSGTTYNTSNFSGPVFIATTTGNKVDISENSEFTITQMRDRSGNNVTSAQTTEYVYKTANTTQLNQLQNRLSDLRAEIEARQQQIGTTTGAAGGGFFPNGLSTGVVAGAGAVILLLVGLRRGN